MKWTRPRPGMPLGVSFRQPATLTTALSTATRAGLALLSCITWGCMLISSNVNPFSRSPQPLEEQAISGEGDNKLLLMELTGQITSEEQSTALGLRTRESTVARVEAELQLAAEDDRVRAIVLRINSPGGSVTASDIIYERITRLKNELHVPVVAELMDVATSGGYYAALAADEIIAHPTSVTGSIGVIFQSISLAGLLDKIGVSNQSVATGSMKDIGSPLRTMTAQEREVIEALLGQMQDRFVGLVRERRPNLTPGMDELMQDGRVFGAQQALEGGLVDRIGYLEEAIERAKQRAGLKTATVIMYRRPSEFAGNIYARAGGGAPQVNLINLDLESSPRPQFLYLWAP